MSVQFEYLMTPENVEKLQNAVPRGRPPKAGMLWCPYHSQWSEVEVRSDTPHLSCCGISLHCFWVKMHNRLWETKGRKKTKVAIQDDDDEDDE